MRPIPEVFTEAAVRAAYERTGLRPTRNMHLIAWPDGDVLASPGAALAIAQGAPLDGLLAALDADESGGFERLLACGLRVDRGALAAFLAGWDGDAPEDAQPEADEHRDAYEHGLALGVALLGERGA